MKLAVVIALLFVSIASYAQPKPYISTRVLVQGHDLPAYYTFVKRFGFFSADPQFDSPLPATELFLTTDGQIRLTLMRSDKPHTDLAVFTDHINEIAKRFEFRSGVNSFVADDSSITEIDIAAPGGITVYVHPTTQRATADTLRALTCGKFLEFSLGVSDLDSAIEFWKLLDYQVVSRDSSSHPSARMTGGDLSIGLYTDPNFEGPALTYASMNGVRDIAAIRKGGIEPIVTLENKKGETVMASFQAPEGLYVKIHSTGN